MAADSGTYSLLIPPKDSATEDEIAELDKSSLFNDSQASWAPSSTWRSINESIGPQFKSLAQKCSVLTLLTLWTSVVAYVVLLAYGLTATWSITSLEMGDDKTELYKAKFWDNVKQFWDSGGGARVTAALLFLSGLVTPVVRFIQFALVLHARVDKKLRHNMIARLEYTGKVSYSCFYVVSLLSIGCGIKVGAPTSEETAEVVYDLHWGMLAFYLSQQVSVVTTNMLRVTHNMIEHPEGDSVVFGTSCLDVGNTPRPCLRTPATRLIQGSIALLALISFAGAFWEDVMSFEYNGLLSKDFIFITDNPNRVDLHGIFDKVLYPDPLFISTYFYFWMWATVAAAPLIMSFAGLICALSPDDWMDYRYVVAKITRVIQPWCNADIVVLSVIVTVPNILTVSRFVFDTSDECKDLKDMSGESCLTVTAQLLGSGGFALLAYGPLTLLCGIWSVHPDVVMSTPLLPPPLPKRQPADAEAL